MSLLNTVSRIAGSAARRRSTVPAPRRGTGTGMGTGIGTGAAGRRSTGTAAATGILGRFLRRR